MAILALGFSLIGAFIVRSGVLTSVHAFANDPERGVYLLAITGIFMGGALSLYAVRASEMQAKGVFSTVSRESALVLNNVLLAVATFVVFIGTIWPLIAEMAFDRKVSVGPPFFDAAFTPFMVLLALLLPIGSILPWKRAKLERSLRPLWLALLVAFALFALIWTVQTGRTLLAPMGALLASCLVFGAIADLWVRSGRGSVSDKLGRAWRLPRADWGRVVAHSGFGITIFGIAALLAWEIEDVRTANVGDTFTVGAYDVTLLDVREVEGPNYLSTMAELQLTRGNTTAILTPESRFYPVAGMPTTEAAISNGIFRDLYAVIGDEQSDGSWAIRVFIKPFANWIWAGAIIMSIGGLLSLTDRRFRVAPGASKARATVPAE